MTVYVDDMYQQSLGKVGRMKMSHMIADTEEELHAMADAIGVKRKWWQGPEKSGGSTGGHYDIALSSRTKAIEHGAIEITLRQCACMNTRRRLTGELGKPEDAIEWRRSIMSKVDTN